MSTHNRPFIFSILSIFVLLFSLATPFAASAEDGAPPVEVGTPEPGVEPASPASEPVNLPEVLAQAPDETEVVVINPEGNSEPLVTQQAAEIISNSDPVWCPEGETPGGANCTPNRASLTDLLADLATKTGAGTIYFQSGAYSGSETSLDLDHSGAYANLTNLGLEGGWDLTTNPAAPTKVLNGTTTFTVPLSLTGWTGNLNLRDIAVLSTDAEAALTASTTGNLTLTNVDAGNNTSPSGVGAYLNTCVSVGGVCTGTGDITVTDGEFSQNAGSSGLYLNPGGNLTLNGVQANQNGYYGADIVDHTAAGDVEITDSQFNDNDDTGLSVITNGKITLNSVQANLNNNGAYLDALKDVSLSGTALNQSTFNSNTWTGLDVRTPGSIALEYVEASQNGVTGAYLDARNGNGGITVQNSTFFSNGDLGLKGMTGKGNITLDTVEIDSDHDSNHGAWLKTFSGGTVLIQDSLFENSLGNGFEVISSGNVNLVANQAADNAANGGQVDSTYAYACFGPRGIVVTLDSGIYQTNGQYGLFVSPGPEGSLVRQNSPLFSSNTRGDFYLDLEDHCKSEPCDDPTTTPTPKPTVTPPPSVTPEPKPTEIKKPINEVVVPPTGGDPVPQDCENTAGTLLKFENGTSVEVGCPFEGESTLESVEKDQLPQPLPFGPEFVSALSVNLTKDGQALEDPALEGKVTLSFKIPADLKGSRLSILYWDPTAKDGAGDWIELPLDQFGGAEFPLHPEDPEDGRTIFSGVEISGDTITFTVNFPGVFALVSR